MDFKKLDNELKASLVDEFRDLVEKVFPDVKNKYITDLSDSDLKNLACFTIGFFQLTEEYRNPDLVEEESNER